jgi:FixJ family two-component response regulator
MQAVTQHQDFASPPLPVLRHVSLPGYYARREERLRDVIYLVDTDSGARSYISALLSPLEVNVMAFDSADQCLAFTGRDTAVCAILNVSLPGIGGLELQRQLAQKGNPPVIFISDRCDVVSTVTAMKAGAIEFLTKPVDPSALIAAVHLALAQERRQRQKRAELAELQDRFSLLTPRERQVLPLVVGGLLNKQAASVLGISEVTLQIHRSQVMRKMQADSLADLVRMAVKLRIPYWREPNHKQEELSRGLPGGMERPVRDFAVRRSLI